jgi:hypothetical protein
MLRIFNDLRTLLYEIENKEVAGAQNAKKCVHECTLTGADAAGNARLARNSGVRRLFTPPYSTIGNQRQGYFVSNSLRNGFQ